MSLNLVPRGVGCRDPSSQKDGTEGSLSMRRPNQRLPWPQSTGWLRATAGPEPTVPSSAAVPLPRLPSATARAGCDVDGRKLRGRK